MSLNHAELMELVQLQEEYEELVIGIKVEMGRMEKMLQIRLREWLKVLSSVINNVIWRRSRNLYARVLYAMLQLHCSHSQNNHASSNCQPPPRLTHPFDKMPPEGGLQKLSIYEIDYALRDYVRNPKSKGKLEQFQEKSKEEEKQARNEFNENQAHKQRKSTNMGQEQRNLSQLLSQTEQILSLIDASNELLSNVPPSSQVFSLMKELKAYQTTQKLKI